MMGYKEVVGSLAGDDTIFLAMRTIDSASSYSDELSKFMKSKV
jgi:arginine repressor